MPKPSLSQKLGKKPSRSYLAKLDEAGNETGSVYSIRSGESGYSHRPGGAVDDDTGFGGSPGSSPARRRLSSFPGMKLTPRSYAASDVGMSYSTSTSRLGNANHSATLRGGAGGSQTGDRYSPAGDKRRSVTFGDLNPALFNERDNLEVMSDIGGYGRGKRNRTFSVASSIDGGDRASDAGSTLSQSRRASVRRGSKSEKVTRTTPSMDLWHNNLGGPGLVRRSEASGTVTSTSKATTDIVQRKSTLSSPKKLLERDPQPSRRYSLQPGTTGTADGQPSGSVAGSDSGRLNIPHQDGRAGSVSDKDSGSEASFGLRTKVHSRHSQKQRLNSGLDPVGTTSSTSAAQNGTSANGINGSARPADLKRSNSASSTGSKKSTRSTTNTSTSSGAKGKALDLHSNTLKNNLMNMPTPPASPSKKKRTPEQVVEALAKAGLLERVMEVVQEADEEESGVSSTEGNASRALRQQQPTNVPTITTATATQNASAPTMYYASPQNTAPSALQNYSTSNSTMQNYSIPQAVAPSTMQNYSTPSSAMQNYSTAPGTAQSYSIPPAVAQNYSAPQPTTQPVPELTQQSSPELTREELVQTPASEFATPPSTPPDTPTAEEAPVGAPWGSIHEGTDTPKQAQSSNAPTAVPIPVSQALSTTGDAGFQGPYKQVDVIISAGVVPIPTPGNGPPVKLESLSAQSTFDPHLVARSLQGTVLALAYHDLSMIFARCTWNNWANYEEVVATPIQTYNGSQNENLKRYQFNWPLPPGTNAADVHLALRLEDGSTNQAHWDNNGGSNYFARLSPIEKRAPSPASTLGGVNGATPAGSGHATPTSGLGQDSASAIPPRVFLVRTQSDDQREPTMLYDPNRRSLVIDGQVMNFVPPSSDVQQSAIPFPHGHPAPLPQPINIETASTTGSSYSVPTPTASIRDGATNAPMNGMNGTGLYKHVSAEEAAAVERAALNTSLPPSRAHSVSSRASGDSTNAPFHYPSSRVAAYQSSALQQQSSLRRRTSRDMHGTPDMPSIMTAFETQQRTGSGPDDLSSIYTSEVRNASNHSLPNGSAAMHVRSPTSDTGSVSAQSQGGLSAMSVPAAQRVNTKMEPKPFSISALTNGKVILPTSNSTMRALTLTSNATQTLNRSFWRNNTQKTLRQNPKLPDHLNGKLNTSATITFSNLTPVPHKVRGDECLVQVFASALDFWDRAKVEILHTRGQGYGFVPGRAFVGKVLECGNDVDPSKVKRGDFVYGLADLRKSGALAEYVTVQRGMLSQAPNGVLSLEQIAAIALSGISAFQAMDELCSTLPRGSKLIIMNAHEGVGALALQLGHSLRPGGDLWMIGHFPADFSDGDSILRQLGASETLCGEPVAALQSLRESTYDAVLDTIGGRKIYDASKRILHDDGYFVTTVGDALSMPTPKANWRKQLKALFKNRDRKNIMYWFPSVDADARAALVRLREIAETGQIKPVVKRVYKFEDGPKAFQGPSEQAVVMILDQEKLANGNPGP